MIKENDIVTTRNDRSQIVHYNNPFFYCFAVQQCYMPSKTYHATEHWHEDIEFLYVIDGQIDYFVNGEKIELKAGKGICVNSKRIHSNHSEIGEFCEFYCVIIHPSYLAISNYIEQKYVAPVLSHSSFDYLLLNRNDWTKDIINDIEHLFQYAEPKTLELEIMEASFRTLRYIYNNIDLSGTEKATSPMYVDTFKAMMLFIQDHYMEKISLDDIANSGNVGKTLCAKIFKKYVSSTPGDYLIRYRITKSLELLTKSDMSITEVAYATGFTSASYYTKTFRELIGTTPNHYRGGQGTFTPVPSVPSPSW